MCVFVCVHVISVFEFRFSVCSILSFFLVDFIENCRPLNCASYIHFGTKFFSLFLSRAQTHTHTHFFSFKSISSDSVVLFYLFMPVYVQYRDPCLPILRCSLESVFLSTIHRNDSHPHRSVFFFSPFYCSVYFLWFSSSISPVWSHLIIIKTVTPLVIFTLHVSFFFLFSSLQFPVSHNEISRYSSEEISGNESNEATTMTESERQAEINRQKEEMKLKRRKKKRTSSSMQSSTFKGKRRHTHTKHAEYNDRDNK